MPQESVLHAPETSSKTGLSPSPPFASADESDIDLFELGEFALRDKFLILKFALAAAVITAIVVLIMKPYYTGEASFLPPNSMSTGGSSALLGQLGALGASSSALGFKDPTLVYVGILGSRTVADDLIKKFDLAKVYKTNKLSQTEAALESHTKIVSGKDTIVTVSVKDTDPKRAAELANAYLDALHKLNDRIALTEAGQKRLFFGEQLEKEKDSLADAEVELTRTQEQSGLIQPLGQTQLQMEAIVQIQAQIASREVELAAMSQGATDQNPNMIRVRSEIEGLKAQQHRLENSTQKSGPGNTQIPTSKVPELTLSYIRKARDVKYHEALYELLLRQYESAKMDEARSAPLMQIVDYAVVPDTKSGPRRALLTLAAFVVGGFLGLCWTFTKYALGLMSAARQRRAI